MATRREFVTDVISDARAAELREMSFIEKWEMIDALHREYRAKIRAAAAKDHPEWNQTQIDAEVAKRFMRHDD